MSRPDHRPGVRVVFEDTLQPFVEISCDAAVSYVLANQAGIVRARGDLVGSRALLDESAARFEDSGDEAGNAAVLVRRAYLELSEGALPRARQALQSALEIRRARVIGAVLASHLPGLGLSTRRPGTTRAPNDTSPKRVICFDARAIDGRLRARSGEPPILPSHSETSTTRRPRFWRPVRCSSRPSESGGSRTPSSG